MIPKRSIPCFALALWLGVFSAGRGAESVTPRVPEKLTWLAPGAVTLGGPMGEALARSEQHRILAQDVDALLKPFRERKDKHEWRSEFWGKWITSAIAAWRYHPDPQLRAAIEQAVAGLIATQTADGYIGAYPDGGHLQRWDIWGRKYTLLGLLAWHEASGDEAALAAARREADFLLSEVGPGRASPFTNDMWNGMASSSVLEPMVLLYRRTGDSRYLAFAQYLVDAWAGPTGPDLLNKSLAGTPVFDMFPKPKPVVKDYHDHGKSKAYEMMSCYEGLAELYRVTGDPRYLEAVQKVYADIRDTEITVIGSGSDWERWYNGKRRQTEVWSKGMETCVTVTWIKLAGQVFRLTEDPACMDEIERATFNALLGAQAVDGTWWCHHTPLAGVKERAPEQCDMAQNCCVASGPRGLTLLPRLAIMNRADGPVLNLYAPMQAEVALAGGGKVKLEEKTEYPAGGAVEIKVDPDQSREFTLSLRIPGWSERTRLTINGKPQPDVSPQTYMRLRRRWQAGDVVRLELDMRARVVSAPGDARYVAVIRGPLVLARDERLAPGTVEQPVALRAGEIIDVQPVAGSRPATVAQVFSVGDSGLLMCDFASAGNTWTDASRYRVWMPRLEGEAPGPGEKSK
jgi:DUF1680 family protein